MASILVSVIMPTYNHAIYIKEAIQSVFNQGLDDIEIIVIDNYSIDNTLEVISDFDDARIRVIQLNNKGIIAASRNAGIRIAQGKYIAFLDSDDIWENGKLIKQLSYFNKRKEYMLISTNMITFTTDGIEKTWIKMTRNEKITFRKLLWMNKISNSSVIMKKEVVDIVGYLDESPDIRTVIDYNYWLRVVLKIPGSILILKEPLLKYRIHESNVSKESDPFETVKKVETLYNQFLEYDPIFIKKCISNRYFNANIDLLYNKKCTVSDFLYSKHGSIFDKYLVVIKYFIRQFFF